MAGISEPQAHRIKEDFQRASLVFNLMESRAKERKDRILQGLVSLGREEYDAIWRDMEGMLNGNKKERKKR